MNEVDHTGAIGSGVRKRRDSIPEDKRCPTCRGGGMISSCGLGVSVYRTCMSCDGTGRNDQGLWLSDARRKARQEQRAYRDAASGDLEE